MTRNIEAQNQGFPDCVVFIKFAKIIISTIDFKEEDMDGQNRPDNLAAMAEESVTKFTENPLFGTKNGSGDYDWITYGQFGKRVTNLRGGLASIGVKKDDFVGVISTNRVEWAVSAYATYGRAARFVPMYEQELSAIWKYIINDATIKVLIVSNSDIYEQVKDFPKEIPTLEKIYIMEAIGDNSMKALEGIGEKAPVAPTYPSPDDIAGLIYTSGTTGEPKGVLLSHRNLVSNAQAGYYAYNDSLDADSRALSILPWAHSYAQTAELNNFMQFGGSIGFAENVTTIIEDLGKVQPTHLIAVPRIFNKVYDGLWAKMNDQGGIAKKLFVMGVESAKKKRSFEENGGSSAMNSFKLKIADKVVFKKIRQKFGGRIKAALTASATMNVDVGNFFFDIGIPVYDCYGLTETSPALTLNSPAAYKIGTVGKPIQGSKVVIDTSVTESDNGEGEIVAYGPNVMQGYHNKPAQTKAVMTSDGGFRTGDVGRLDTEGYLHITGRIKEQYKLENGKYVFPASIEEEIKLIPYVANAMIYGDGRRFNICLVIPDFEVMEKYAIEHSLPTDPASLVKNEQVQDLISKEIATFLKGKYGGYEIPKKFLFMHEDFTTENGMLTQTLKLKRRIVLDKFEDEIEKLYQ